MSDANCEVKNADCSSCQFKSTPYDDHPCVDCIAKKDYPYYVAFNAEAAKERT